jgi:CheY-like chemotaxis protein
MAADIQPGEMLVRTGLVTQNALEQALTRQRSSGQRLGAILCEMGIIKEEQWIASLAKEFGFKTVNTITGYSFPPDLINLVPGDFANKHLVFPLKQKDGMLALAVTDPFDTEVFDSLIKRTGLKPVPFLASRADIAAALKTHYPSVVAAPAAGRKILVVDDSHAIVALISKALQHEGYQVVVGHDGMEGLKLALSERPDLIITDTVMPRMDGFELLRALKANAVTARIPTILVTARSGCEDEQRALEAGFLDFISKPIQPVRLLSRIKRAFELSQSMQGA